MDSSKAGAYAGGIIGIVAGMLIGFSTDMSTTGITWLTAIFLFLGTGIGMHMHEKKEKEARHEQEKYITFFETAEGRWNAELHRRGPVSASNLKVEGIEYTATTYHPEELRFGAVSVGGFTTGGTYKVDAYKTVKSGGKSGRGLIWAKLIGQGKSVPLERIILATPKLVEQAKKDAFIKQFLQGNSLVLIREYSIPRELAALHTDAYVKGNYTLTEDIQMKAFADAQLRISDCDKIIKWVASGGRRRNSVSAGMTWKCDKCGNQNPSHTRECICGRSRFDIK